MKLNYVIMGFVALSSHFVSANDLFCQNISEEWQDDLHIKLSECQSGSYVEEKCKAEVLDYTGTFTYREQYFDRGVRETTKIAFGDYELVQDHFVTYEEKAKNFDLFYHGTYQATYHCR